MLQKFMEAIQAWITEHVVPVMNKLTSTYWFGVISDAVLYIVPFSMVSAIPSMWNIIRRFVPTLPDLSPLTTFSFGLVGMFMAFIIPHNVAVKEDRKDRSMIAGFTGIGAFMLCMNPTITDEGYVFQMAKFGAGGMFTAMVVGFVVGFIYKRMARMTFFSEDSLVPDFVKNWFDNIIAVLLSLFVAWLFTNMLQVDVFGAVAIILSPVTGFAQTLPGTIAIPLVMDTFYFFGISGWVFSPIQQSIQKSALAENMAAYAAGLAPTNINAYGITRYIMIGGEGATLPLAFYMLFAKSKKNKTLGRATIIPSLFNINEPLVFHGRRQPLYVHPYGAAVHPAVCQRLSLDEYGLGEPACRELRHELPAQCGLGVLYVGRGRTQYSAGLRQPADRRDSLVPVLQGCR